MPKAIRLNLSTSLKLKIDWYRSVCKVDMHAFYTSTYHTVLADIILIPYFATDNGSFFSSA